MSSYQTDADCVTMISQIVIFLVFVSVIISIIIKNHKTRAPSLHLIGLTKSFFVIRQNF